MGGITQQLALGAKCFLEPFSHGVECTRETRDFVPAGPHGRQDALREITYGDMLSGTPQLVKWKGQVAAEQQASQRAYQCRNTDGKRNDPWPLQNSQQCDALEIGNHAVGAFPMAWETDALLF